MLGNETLLTDKTREFLLEDLGMGDVTTDSLINESLTAMGEIVCKEEGVIAGLAEASKIFEILECTVQTLVSDGDRVALGTVIMKLKGSARAILKGERTALNILMRMSGIATATNTVLLEAKKIDPKIRIACTRKTALGLRYFDKRAVELGGGDTHRLRLDDCVLIKNNHLRLVGSIGDALRNAKARVSFTKKIEIEVENLDQAIEAVQNGADIIMLDNLKPKEIVHVLSNLERRKLRNKVLVEASGGITQDNVKMYATSGVDIISMGSLTHSVRALNMSMTVLKD